MPLILYGVFCFCVFFYSRLFSIFASIFRHPFSRLFYEATWTDPDGLGSCASHADSLISLSYLMAVFSTKSFGLFSKQLYYLHFSTPLLLVYFTSENKFQTCYSRCTWCWMFWQEKLMFVYQKLKSQFAISNVHMYIVCNSVWCALHKYKPKQTIWNSFKKQKPTLLPSSFNFSF